VVASAHGSPHVLWLGSQAPRTLRADVSHRSGLRAALAGTVPSAGATVADTAGPHGSNRHAIAVIH